MQNLFPTLPGSLRTYGSNLAGASADAINLPSSAKSALRGEERRHAKPIIRCGSGSANASSLTFPWLASTSMLIRGKSVTPRPFATI